MTESFRFLKYAIIPIILLSISLVIFSLFSLTSKQFNSLKLRANDIELAPSDKLENIFWFVQISDIHISSHHDPSRVSDLKDFVEKGIGVINPSLILTTGDLVDGKSKDDLSTQPDIQEWKSYFSVLEDTYFTKQIPWLDLRGNHDCFDVTMKYPESNLFKIYSSMGMRYNLHSYKYVHKTNYGNYSFIGIDACPEPGLKRPFNFFGELSDRDAVELRIMARECSNHNFTIWFSHYPTATISVEYNRILRPALESTNTLAYICGHLHNFGGLTYNLYAMHPEGHLELELSDWKNSRRYRIMSIDHDLFSFIDTTYKKWPVILLTNPKDIRLSSPIVEPLDRIKVSTHIRILVFSPYKIDCVVVRIDGVKLEQTGRHVKGPLFVIKWAPKDYAQGLHLIEVEVDSIGEKSTVTSYFSFDGDFPIYSIMSNLILLSHPSSLLFYVFNFVWIFFVVATLFSLFAPLKYEAYFVILRSARALRDYFSLCLLWLIANVYMIFGPWSIGNVSSYHPNGIVYLSGIQLPSEFVSHCYMYGIALEQLLTFNIPSTILLLVTAWGNKIPKNYVNTSDILLYMLVINQSKRCYNFLRWLGWIGFIINPSTSWMLLLFIYTYSQVKRGSRKFSL